MTKLIWNSFGERQFETGIDRGVLYLPGRDGVAWNGLTAVQESPTGGEAQPYYLDGYKYANVSAAEEYEATLEAFSAPLEFGECDGTAELSPGLFLTQQPRKSFSFSYRTLIGNDLEGVDFGYKLHLVYNATAEPADRTYSTLNDSPDPSVLSWRITTLPPRIPGRKPTAHFVIDSRRVAPAALAVLEGYLYGSEGVAPRLPSPARVIDWLQEMQSVSRLWTQVPRPLNYHGDIPVQTNELRNLVHNPRGRDTYGTVVIRENLHNPALINNFAFSSTFGPDMAVAILDGNSNYRGYTLPVIPGETFTVTRTSITSRFRWVFTVDPPVAGGPNFGGTGMSTEYDKLNSATITVPSGANYLLLYLSNAGEDTTNTLIERGTESKPYFDGDTWDGDPDFTPEWTGTPGASTSRLVGNKVAGIYSHPTNGSTVISSVRWSPTGDTSLRITGSYSKGTGTAHDTFATIFSSMRANTTYTILATAYIEEAQPSTTNFNSRRIYAYCPTTDGGKTYFSDASPNAASTVDHRLSFTTPDNLSGAGFIRLMFGHTEGEMWWGAISVIEGEYDGPYFDGDVKDAVYNGQVLETHWEGVPHNGESYALEVTSLPSNSSHGDMVVLPSERGRELFIQQSGIWRNYGILPQLSTT